MKSVLKYLPRHLARLAGATVFACAGIPAQAQWNMYGNGGSFFVPITTESNVPPNGNGKGGPPTLLVSLTLNGRTNPFILDTGSLGLVASTVATQTAPIYYTPGSDTQLAPYATITYSTSGDNPVGALYLTNVQINGTSGSVIARVPILAAGNGGFHQLGVGFDRGGVMIGVARASATGSMSAARRRSAARSWSRRCPA